MENVFFKNKSEAGESEDYNILVQSGEHIVHNEQTLSNDPQDAKGRVKKKFKSVEFSTPTRFFYFFSWLPNGLNVSDHLVTKKNLIKFPHFTLGVIFLTLP